MVKPSGNSKKHNVYAILQFSVCHFLQLCQKCWFVRYAKGSCNVTHWYVARNVREQPQLMFLSTAIKSSFTSQKPKEPARFKCWGKMISGTQLSVVYSSVHWGDAHNVSSFMFARTQDIMYLVEPRADCAKQSRHYNTHTSFCLLLRRQQRSQ